VNKYLSGVLWIALAHCMTGPDSIERLGVQCGVNCGEKYDFDNDRDIDLRDVAEFMNRLELVQP
jgi:hypothetical protein